VKWEKTVNIKSYTGNREKLQNEFSADKETFLFLFQAHKLAVEIMAEQVFTRLISFVGNKR